MTEQTPPPVPPQNPLQAALAAVTELTKRVGTLTDEVKRLRTYGRRNRKYILIDIVITLAIFGLGYLGVRTANAANQNGVTITQLHQTQIAGCIAGNQTRAQEIQLWDHLAAISKPSPGETPKEIAANKKAVDQFLAYVAHVFAPRQCRTLYRLPGGSS